MLRPEVWAASAVRGAAEAEREGEDAEGGEMEVRGGEGGAGGALRCAALLCAANG